MYNYENFNFGVNMKKIAFILALVLCCGMLFSCGDPKAKDILDDDGNVVAVGYYKGNKLVYKEETNDKGDLEARTTYDDDGKVEKLEKYAGGKLKSESVYEYGDKKGNYTEKRSNFSHGVVISVTEDKYENGRIVLSETVVSKGGDEAKSDISKYTYDDEKGTVKEELFSGETKVKEVLTDKDGKVVYTLEINEGINSVKTYYEDKKITKVENYNKKGDLLISIVNEYDSEGTIKGSKTYNANGELREYSNYVYKDGVLLGMHRYNPDGTISSTIEYDSNGKATIHDGIFIDLD